MTRLDRREGGPVPPFFDRMRQNRRMAPLPRILLHTGRDRRLVVDPADVCFLEAAGARTRVRLARRRAHLDNRSLAELLALFRPHGFVRIHRHYAVNALRLREIRRHGERGWEVKLEPPVNKVLPVGREHLRRLWKLFGEK